MRSPELLSQQCGYHRLTILLRAAVCPTRTPVPIRCLLFDLDVDTRRQIQPHQRVHRLRRRVHNVHQPLVGANLKLFARFLVHMGDRFTVNFEVAVGSGMGR